MWGFFKKSFINSYFHNLIIIYLGKKAFLKNYFEFS